MKATNKYVFDVPEKEAYKTKLGDLEIYFDADFGSEFDNMIHYGVLVAKPKSAKLDVEVGDTVYFSHLAKSFESNIQVGDKKYYCLDTDFAEGKHELYQILLCTDNKPLGNVTMVERIEKPEKKTPSGIILTTQTEYFSNRFRVTMSNNIKRGTEIIVSDDADYEFLDKDREERIAIQDEHIVATVEDGELVPYGKYALIEAEDDLSEDFVLANGVYAPKDKVLRGWGKWKGQRVFFHKVNSNGFEYKKNKYSACLHEDIYYICD